MTAPLDEIVLKKGTVIQVAGFPFELKDDVVVLGRLENARLAAILLHERTAD